MNRALNDTARTLAIVSTDYIENSNYAQPEWAAAFAKDPQGFKRQFIPVRVRECQVEGLLGQIIHIDLVGKSEAAARRELLDGTSGRRAKPVQSPKFPGADPSGSKPQSPLFPGGSGSATPAGRNPPERYVPAIRRPPSDLERRRFVQSAFEAIRQHFERALNVMNGQNGVDVDLIGTSVTQFTAELFVNGESRRRCKVWVQNAGIAFHEGVFVWDGDNSYNEMLSLVPNELALSALMKAGWGNEEKGLDLDHLTKEAAAEYLWRRFASRLG